MDQPKQIEYVPLRSEVFYEFAKQVCEGMAEKQNDPRFLETEVRLGLAHFLEVINKITVKALNDERLKMRPDGKIDWDSVEKDSGH